MHVLAIVVVLSTVGTENVNVKLSLGSFHLERIVLVRHMLVSIQTFLFTLLGYGEFRSTNSDMISDTSSSIFPNVRLRHYSVNTPNTLFSETILNQTKMDYDMPYDPYDLANLRNVAPAQDN